jgi:hypothetical protein
LRVKEKEGPNYETHRTHIRQSTPEGEREREGQGVTVPK